MGRVRERESERRAFSFLLIATRPTTMPKMVFSHKAQAAFACRDQMRRQLWILLAVVLLNSKLAEACLAMVNSGMPRVSVTTSTLSPVTTTTAVAACKTGYTLCTASSQCFKIFVLNSNQEAAEAICIADGGHLASLHSTAETTCVNTLLTAITFMGCTMNFMCPVANGVNCAVWIGLDRIGPGATNANFMWTDGTTVDYTNWLNPGMGGVGPQPDNNCVASGNGEPCTLIGLNPATFNKQWADYQCDTTASGFVCKQAPM